MVKFQLEKGSEVDVDVLDRRLNEYNLEIVPKPQKEESHPLPYAVHNHKGQLIGGISPTIVFILTSFGFIRTIANKV
ncbi:hypothetical protein [uncultured Vagococcus sp.]|uniref:hypothetical protein n=1 Tax=uncultured Vagococcus sp. TaxID=189676 RepID=UPI0028D464E6|nr:hypothetical protein [uncultured Vagococcus sp.]